MKIADMHCDTISRIYHEKRAGRTVHLRENTFQVDLCRMKTSGYLLQNFAAFVELKPGVDPYVQAKEEISLFREEIAGNSEEIGWVTSYEDIVKNEKTGKMSALLTLEEGAVCQGELAKLHEFYQLGVRMMTFTWNFQNELGSPAEPAEKLKEAYGLTEKGREFLAEMERIGMIADVSHLSDEGILDVCRLANKPFVASHSNARALCKRMRNLPDELIRKIAEKGGVIGVNFYGPFLTDQADERGNYYGRIEDVVRHATYLRNLAGTEAIALGTDFDGIDEYLELSHCGQMERLWNALKSHGWKESELDAMFYRNVCRLYRELL